MLWEDVGNARTDAQPADGHDLQDVTEIHTYMISQLGIHRAVLVSTLIA